MKPRLVHGDLGGDNLRWTPDGAVGGVIDWDLAQPFDPAVDAACLASWYGWDNLSHAVDAETFQPAPIPDFVRDAIVALQGSVSE